MKGIVSILLLMGATSFADECPATDPIALTPRLQVQTIEPGVYLIVHRFPAACNSLLVQCAPNTFVWVDTPLTNEATAQVHQWLKENHHDPNLIQINTGFHNDNLAGNGYLISQGIPCYGANIIPKLIKDCWPNTVKQVLPYHERQGERFKKGLLVPLVPPNRLYPLKEGLTLQLGPESVEVYFPGPSHTLDNVVVYFPKKRILFGGCMIKAANTRTPGFTGDADMAAWPRSVEKVLERYPNARLVFPGHGRWGDHALTRHTLELLKKYNQGDN